MKRIIQKIIAASVCLLLAATLLYAQAPTAQDDPAKLKAEIGKILLEISEAYGRRDPKVYERYLAPTFSMVNPQNEPRTGPGMRISQAIVREFPAEAKVSSRIENLEVTGDQRAAVATYIDLMSFELNQNRNEMRQRVSSFFVRNGETWQLLAQHRTYLSPVRTPKKLEAKALDAIVGEYQAEDGKPVIVSREGDTLFSQRADGPKLKLTPENDTAFYANVGGTLETIFTFLRNDEGKVTQMIVHNPLPANSVFVRKKIK